MTALLLALLAATADERPALVSVHANTVEGRPAVEVVTTTAPVRVGLQRVGPHVVLSLDARLPRSLGPIAPLLPLQAIDVGQSGSGVAVRIRVDGDVPYEVRRQGTLLTVLFGEKAPTSHAPPPRTGDVPELYRGLMPAPLAESSATEAGETRPLPESDRWDGEAEGLQIGLITLRPSISGVYIDAANALLETARPIADRYYEVRPRLAGDFPVRTGRLQADYEARVRQGSSFSVVEDTTTHLANLALDVPLGSSLVWRAGGHFARGLLETTEVDPGREYFFDLGRYTRYDLSAGMRVKTSGRLDLDLSGSHYRVDVDESAGFFDHDHWAGSAGLGVELGPRARAEMAYTYEEIPSSLARAQAAMQAHAGSLSLQGEILPLVTGYMTVGYRDQRNPAAGPGGARYSGLTASARVLKEFTPSTAMRLTASRSTPASGFENNGFFVASAVLGELDLALPFSLIAHAGLGYHRNEYRVASVEIGPPREDRITSWQGGLGRSIAEWAFARVDYRYEQRASNIDRFATDAHALTAQLDVRFYRPRVRR